MTDAPVIKRSHIHMTARFWARLRAAQGLYQRLITHAPASVILEDFFYPSSGESKDPPFDAAHFTHVIQGTLAHEAEIKQRVCQYLDPSWPFERVDTILIAILYAGCFEILFCPDIPFKVVINEYINVARAFFGESDTLHVVNGVLDAVAKSLISSDNKI